MYSIDYFVDMYKKEFPNKKHTVERHIELNGIFLGHIFFDEEICGPLCRLLRRTENSNEVERFVKIIELMLLEGDDYVKSVVVINILNTIKNDKDIIETAMEYFSEDTIETLRLANDV
ncbi:MAG: hypothetical protein JEZ08_03735 [Clostridiales bacterium]|nr:hypothetical protein [Clostridiales bacterium]